MIKLKQLFCAGIFAGAISTLSPVVSYAYPISGVSANVSVASGARAGASVILEKVAKTASSELALREKKQAMEAARRKEELRQAEEAERAKQAAEEAARQAAIDAENKIVEEAAYNIPSEANTKAHPYMPYTAVTNRWTKQYRVLHDVNAWSDTNTGLRMIGDRICIAIGQGYGMSPGDKVDVVLSDGTYLKCIVGDMKAEIDTDPTMRYHLTDRDVVEMIVDYRYFHSTEQYLSLFKNLSITKLVKIQ